MIIRIAVLSLLIIAPIASHAATCTIDASADWGPIGTVSPTTALADGDNQCSDSNPPGADDDFVIDGSGVVVAGIADITQNAADIGITVSNGATFSIDVGDKTGGEGIITVSLGNGDLTAITGPLETNGRYCQGPGTDDPTVGGFVNSPEYFRVGDLLPCATWNGSAYVSDCATNPDLYGFIYPHDVYDQGDGQNGDQHLPDAFGACPAGSVLQFRDPDLSTPHGPADDIFSYEVIESTADKAGGGAGPAAVIFDVRQTDPADPVDSSYPLARREVKALTLEHPATRGDRFIDVAAGTIASDEELTGRSLRFELADGSPDTHSYMITKSRDQSEEAPCSSGSPCDRLFVMSYDGLRSDYADNAPFFLDRGFRVGDTFAMYVPVVFTATDGNQTGDQVYRLGDGTSITRTIIDKPTTFYNTGTNVFQDSWIRDGYDTSTNLFRNSGSVFFNYVSVVGGGEVGAGLDRTHTFNLIGEDARFDFRSVGVRYHCDDVISNGATRSFLKVWRLSVGSRCDEAVSTEVIGNNAADREYIGGASDILVKGKAVNSTLFMPQGGSNSGHFSVKRVVSIGGGHTLSATSDYFHFSDIHMINGFAKANQLRRCYSRDYAGSATLAWSSSSDSASLTDCVFRNIDSTSTFFLGDLRGVQFNNAYIDVRSTASNPLEFWRVSTALASVNWRRITAAWTPGSAESRWDLFMRNNGSATGTYVDGLLVGHFYTEFSGGALFHGTGNFAATLGSNSLVTSGPCAFDFRTPNNADPRNFAVSGTTSNIGTSTTRDVPPGFVDPTKGRFDTYAGSHADANGCGVLRGNRAPGVHSFTWGHSGAGLKPEALTDGYFGGRRSPFVVTGF